MPPLYSSYTYNSSSFIQRWVHIKRFSDAIRLLDICETDRLLDYGCGDGWLLKRIREKCNNIELLGFEPVEDLFTQAINNADGTNIKVVKDIIGVSGSFTKISCLETCEHLPQPELDKLLENIKRLLSPIGSVLISVPIETGLPALIKNGYRILKKEKKHNLSLNRFFRTLIGLPVERIIGELEPGIRYYYSHVGFNHSVFERKLTENFRIVKRSFSPFGIGLYCFNNTVSYICENPKG